MTIAFNFAFRLYYKLYNLLVIIDNGIPIPEKKPTETKEKLGTFEHKTSAKVNTSAHVTLSKSKSGNKDLSHLLNSNRSESKLTDIISYRQTKL